MRIALCLPGLSPEIVDAIEFYSAEVRALSMVGSVDVVFRPDEISIDSDLVFSWWWQRSAPTAVTSKWLRRLPLVISGATDIGNPTRVSPVRALAKQVVARAVGGLASLNLAISNCERDLLRRWRFPHLEVATLGVDTDYYRPTSTSTRNHNLVVTILQLNTTSVQRKGLLRAIDCIAQCRPDVTLVIVGEDQGGRAQAERYARSVNAQERITFTGRISREEKRDLLWRAGVYLQLSEYEGFGYAVAEAMSSGCPVIVSPNGALPEITGGLAYGYALSSVDAAQAIDALSYRPEGGEESSARCLAHCQETLALSARAQRLRALFDAL